MRNWKSPCIKRVPLPLLKQTLLATLRSLISMSFTITLLIGIFDKPKITSGWSIGEYQIIANIVVLLWLNNINSLFIQFLDYLKIFPFLIYSWRCVCMESILFTILSYILVKVDITVLVNPVIFCIYICLPELIIISLIVSFRYIFKKWIAKYDSQYLSVFKSIEYRFRYSYTKNIDISIGIAVPLIPIMIILVMLITYC